MASGMSILEDSFGSRKALIELHIAGHKFGDPGTAHLSPMIRNKMLQVLDVSNNTIGVSLPPHCTDCQ